jgi:hypothetical protein
MNIKRMMSSVVRSTEFGVAGGAALGMPYTLLNVWLFKLTLHPTAGAPPMDSNLLPYILDNNLLAYILGPIVGLIFGSITGLVTGILYGFVFVFLSGQFFESSDNAESYRITVHIVSFVFCFLFFMYVRLYAAFQRFFSILFIKLYGLLA